MNLEGQLGGKLLICDDHPLFCEGLKGIIQKELQNIGRRINEFGGNFDLNSTPDEGTSALLSIPR